MFVGQNGYYFATLRKITASFGSLFNNIYIQRFDQKGGKGNSLRRIKVPLEYAPSQKWWTKRMRDIAAKEGLQTRTSFPRIAFEMTNIQYNPERQLTLSRTCPRASTTSGNIVQQLNPVPYDISYDVYIAVKNIDDGHQIVEQVLPYFRPSMNLNVKDIPELQIVRNVPITLAGISLQDDYEGIFDQPRATIWQLSFVVKAYLYPPISDSEDNLIKKVITSIYNDPEFENKSEVHVQQVDPIDAMIDDSWSVKENIFSAEQLDSAGDPITDSNGDPI